MDHRLIIRLCFQSRLRKIEYKPKSTHQLIDLQIINKHPSCYCICFSKKDENTAANVFRSHITVMFTIAILLYAGDAVWG